MLGLCLAENHPTNATVNIVYTSSTWEVMSAQFLKMFSEMKGQSYLLQLTTKYMARASF
jgi:hypothetical protein